MGARVRAALSLLLLLFVAPVAVLVVGTLYQLRLEPFFDYMAGYVLFLVGFAPAAVLMLIYLLWKGAPRRAASDTVAYLLLGAIGSAAFWGWFSAQDKIGEAGIDPVSFVFGAVLGAVFGATFHWFNRGEAPSELNEGEW